MAGRRRAGRDRRRRCARHWARHWAGHWLDGRRDTGRTRSAPAEAKRERSAGARAHQRDDRPGQGDPAAAWRADDERRRLRHRDRRSGHRIPAPADPAAVPPGRLRPVHAGAADGGDGLHPHGLQPGDDDRRDRGRPDRVLHRRPLDDRHARSGGPPPWCDRPVQPARDRLRHGPDHPVLAGSGDRDVRLQVPADLRQHREPVHDQPAGPRRSSAGSSAARQRGKGLIRLGGAHRRSGRPRPARRHSWRAAHQGRVPVLRLLA